MFDKLLDFVVNSVRAEENVKQEKSYEAWSLDISVPRPASQFFAVVKAGDLIEPCKKKAERHREREQTWVKNLEEAEKELMEKGITLDVFDSSTGTYVKQAYQQSPGGLVNAASICSGAIASYGFSNTGNTTSQQFQPRVDQKMMDAVKNAKTKMLEHREKANTYNKHARAFSVNPEFTIKLSIEDVNFYGLGE